MIVLRFILRFVLVPLGGCLAAFVATIVVCTAHWTEFARLIANDPQAPDQIVLAVITVGLPLIVTLSVGAVAMLMPATLGALIAEIFAIRSWIYHVANGALASWIGWLAMKEFLRDYQFYREPTTVIAAGIAAGFVYWAVAGWNAGFWKPVFAARPVPPPAPPTVAAA